MSTLVEYETPEERAESVARELLNTSAKEAFAMLDRGEIPEGSIAETELRAILWVMSK